MMPAADRFLVATGVARLYRFVPLARVDAFLAAGWIPCLPPAACHHDRYSILMRACACFAGRAESGAP